MTDKAAILEAYARYKDAVDEYIELLKARIHQLETEQISKARDAVDRAIDSQEKLKELRAKFSESDNPEGV